MGQQPVVKVAATPQKVVPVRATKQKVKSVKPGTSAEPSQCTDAPRTN